MIHFIYNFKYTMKLRYFNSVNQRLKWLVYRKVTSIAWNWSNKTRWQLITEPHLTSRKQFKIYIALAVISRWSMKLSATLTELSDWWDHGTPRKDAHCIRHPRCFIRTCVIRSSPRNVMANSLDFNTM